MSNNSRAGAARDGGSYGDRLYPIGRFASGFDAVFIYCLVALGLLTQGICVPASWAQEKPATPEAAERELQRVEMTAETGAGRDSLMFEIREYTHMIRSLRDSLATDESNLQLSPAQREKIEGNISDISEVIERISGELSRMEFEIKDNRISLVNEAGEGIIINVPEDLDQQVSEGIEAITKIILSELPDSVDFDHSKKWDWNRFRPEAPPPPQRIIKGNVVKIWNDVHISDKEDVRGNVVVVFGNAEVSGRVDGSVVTVFGNLLLNDSSEVTGNIVAVGGYLDQDPAAQVDNVVSFDPMRFGRGDGWIGLFSHDGMSFLICQGTFLLTVFMAVLAVVVMPRQRFDNITGVLRTSLMPSLGVGVGMALGGHFVVAILMAVLVLTVIGVPLALLVGMALLMVAVVSVAVCGASIGDRLCLLAGGKCQSPWLVVVVGMTALHGVSFVGSLLGLVGGAETMASLVVVLGMTIKTVAYLLGLGAIVLSRFGSKAATV